MSTVLMVLAVVQAFIGIWNYRNWRRNVEATKQADRSIEMADKSLADTRALYDLMQKRRIQESTFLRLVKKEGT